MRKPVSLALALLTAANFGCAPKNPTRITVMVRACVVRGSNWTLDAQGQPASNSAVNASVAKVFQAVNAIWQPGADISFVAVPNKAGDIPIIDDLYQPASAHSNYPAGPGQVGDIEQEYDSFPTAETIAAVNACNAAWALQFPGETAQNPGILPGIPVVFARLLVDQIGQDSTQSGLSTSNFSNYVRHAGKDLCDTPYKILSTDVVSRWTIIATSSRNINQLNINNATAHELGHDLLLAHGDGVDNNNNGRWDELCDNAEYQAFDLVEDYSLTSLMSPFAGTTKITQLQKKLARSAAMYVPGVIGGPP